MGKNVRLETLITRFRASGGRITPQRQAIINALLASENRHPSIEEIHAAVSREFPMISLATVYKTVNTLVEMGEAQPIGTIQGAMRFDINPKAHPHVVCTQCGRITDLPADEVQKWIDKVRAVTGYDEITPILLFHGRCPECQQAETL